MIPAARARSRTAAPAAAPPTSTEENPASAAVPPGASSSRTSWVGTTETCAQPEAASASAVAAGARPELGAGQQRPDQDLHPGDMGGGQRTAATARPGRAPTRASDERAEWVSAAALSSTPFGSPVDPEVVMMTAVSG